MAVTSPIVSVNYLHYRAMNPATSRLRGSQWEFSLMVMDRRDLACKLIQVYSLLICPIPNQPNGLHFSPWLGLRQSVPLGYIKSLCGRGSRPHLWKREASEGLLGSLKRITASLCWPCFHPKNPSEILRPSARFHTQHFPLHAPRYCTGVGMEKFLSKSKELNLKQILPWHGPVFCPWHSGLSAKFSNVCCLTENRRWRLWYLRHLERIGTDLDPKLPPI